MAKISNKDIFQGSVFGQFQKEANDTLKILDKLEKGFEDFADSIEKINKESKDISSENIEKVNKALEVTNETRENSIKLTKQREEVTKSLAKEEKKRLTEVEKLTERLEKAQSDEGKTLANLRVQINKVNKENRESAKLLIEQTNAYTELTKRTNEAQAEFKRLAAEEFGSKEAEDARIRFEKLDKQLREVNDAANDGRRDVGRYKDAISEAGDELGVLEGDLGNVVSGVKRAGQALRRNPFVLLAGAIAGLGASFGTTNQGAETFASIQARIGAVVSESVGRIGKSIAELSNFSLKDIFFGDADAVGIITKNFEGYNEAIQESADAASAAAIAQIRLDRANRLTNIQIARQQQLFDQASQASGDATTSLKDQTDANIDAARAGARVAQLRFTQIQDQIDILEKQAKAVENNERAVEAIRAQISERTVELIEAETELTVAQQTLSTERRQIAQDEGELRLDVLIDGADNQKTINERIIADESVNQEDRRKLLKETQEFQEQSLRAQVATLQEFAKERIDIDKLLATTDNVQLSEEIKSLGLSEILRTRLLEVIRDQRTATQDLSEAQDDLNKSDQESTDLNKTLIAQQEALKSLREGNDKATKELSKDLEKIQIESLQTQIENLEEGSLERLRLQAQLNDLLINQEKGFLKESEDINDEHRKREEEEQRMADEKRIKDKQAQADKEVAIQEISFNVIDAITKNNFEKQNEKREEEINDLEDRQDQLTNAIQNGNADAVKSLEQANAEEARLRLEKEKDLQKQKRIEAGLAAFKILAAKTEEGDPNALLNTIKEITQTDAFIKALPSFFVGTENLGAVSNPLDSNGGRIIMAHDNERIMTAQQNKRMGGMSNDSVADIIHAYNSGMIYDNVSPVINLQNNDGIWEVTKAIKELPGKMPINKREYDIDRKIITDTYKQANKIERDRQRLNSGILGGSNYRRR